MRIDTEELLEQRDRARDIAAHLESDLYEGDLRADALRAQIRDLEDYYGAADSAIVATLTRQRNQADATITRVKACLLQGGQDAESVRSEAINILIEQP